MHCLSAGGQNAILPVMRDTELSSLESLAFLSVGAALGIFLMATYYATRRRQLSPDDPDAPLFI